MLIKRSLENLFRAIKLWITVLFRLGGKPLTQQSHLGQPFLLFASFTISFIRLCYFCLFYFSKGLSALVNTCISRHTYTKEGNPHSSHLLFIYFQSWTLESFLPHLQMFCLGGGHYLFTAFEARFEQSEARPTNPEWILAQEIWIEVC